MGQAKITTEKVTITWQEFAMILGHLHIHEDKPATRQPPRSLTAGLQDSGLHVTSATHSMTTALCYHIQLQYLCNLQFTHLSEAKLVTLQFSHSCPTLLLFLVLKTGQSFEPPLGSYRLPPIFTSFPICLVLSF